MEEKNYNILLITYSYYPHISPRAFRWTAIAEYWTGQGNSVDVVCNRFSKKHPGRETINGVRVFRAIDPLMPLKSISCDKKMQEEKPEFSRKNSLKKFLSRFMKKTYDLTIKKLYWPDYAFLWIFSGFLKTKELLAHKKYDIIISVSYPFSSHIIGFLCRREFWPGKWIVDIGDPFSFTTETQSNNSKIYRKLNFWAEDKILTASYAISVTNDKTKEKYVQYFRNISKKIHTIPPLLSLPVIPEQDTPEEIVSSGISLLFVGTLYRKIRNPEFLLEIFRQLVAREHLQNLELHFAGDTNDCADILNRYLKLLGKKIVNYGIVSREKVFELMKNAQILVNIDNATSFQLPSKVVEYIATGKPILNITSGKTKFTDHLVIDYPNVFNVDSSRTIDEQLLCKIEDFIINRKVLRKDEIERILAPYKIQTISEKYLSLFSA